MLNKVGTVPILDNPTTFTAPVLICFWIESFCITFSLEESVSFLAASLEPTCASSYGPDY
jgi:hypothetical protein